MYIGPFPLLGKVFNFHVESAYDLLGTIILFYKINFTKTPQLSENYNPV